MTMTMTTTTTTKLMPSERETQVNYNDADDEVRIYTDVAKHIRRLRADARYTEIGSGHWGVTEWASFTCPAKGWTPTSGAKRTRVMTEEQRAEAAARLRGARAAAVAQQ